MRFGIGKERDVFDIDARIKVISELIYNDMFDAVKGPRLRALAGSITQACPVRGDAGQKDADFCEAWTIYEWIVSNIRYSGDIGPGAKHDAMDLYVSPLRVIEYGTGDCDCHVAVAVAILRYLGWNVKARVSSHSGTSWEHIYAVITEFPKVNPYRELVFDTTLGHGKLGKEASYKKKRDFEI